MTPSQAEIVGRELAECLTGEAPIFTFPRVLVAVSNLAAAIAAAEGADPEDIPELAMSAQHAFVRRSQALVEGL